MPVILATWEAKFRRNEVNSFGNPIFKIAELIAQVIECLLHRPLIFRQKVLSSNLSPLKNLK
jgi:hypothetical protein